MYILICVNWGVCFLACMYVLCISRKVHVHLEFSFVYVDVYECVCVNVCVCLCAETSDILKSPPHRHITIPSCMKSLQ